MICKKMTATSLIRGKGHLMRNFAVKCCLDGQNADRCKFIYFIQAENYILEAVQLHMMRMHNWFVFMLLERLPLLSVQVITWMSGTNQSQKSNSRGLKHKISLTSNLNMSLEFLCKRPHM